MALSSLSPSNMLGELGRLASWLKGDCLSSGEYAGLAVTEKVRYPLKNVLFVPIVQLIRQRPTDAKTYCNRIICGEILRFCQIN